VTGFFFFLTEGLLVYFILKYRARPGGKAVHTHGSHGLELAWTFIPGLILFCLAVFQMGAWGEIKFKSEFPAEEDSVVVQVFAKQFEWYFRYAGADGKFGTTDDVTKLGEMHVPVDRNVIVKLRTRDVLHSFWLENVRLKQDLLPGQIIPQWFRITEEGLGPGRTPAKYEIKCAELCGNNHTTMRAVLVVETQEDFDAWLRKQAEASAEYGGHDPKEDPMWKYWLEGPRK
jgi:cytochrome c oxidase subunit 2